MWGSSRLESMICVGIEGSGICVGTTFARHLNVQWTILLVPMVSALERFHCTTCCSGENFINIQYCTNTRQILCALSNGPIHKTRLLVRYKFIVAASLTLELANVNLAFDHDVAKDSDKCLFTLHLQSEFNQRHSLTEYNLLLG